MGLRHDALTMSKMSGINQHKEQGMQHNPRFLALVEAIRPRVKETDVHQIKRWQDEGRAFHLVDVREGERMGQGHLPGPVPWPRGDRAGHRRAIRTLTPSSTSIVVGISLHSGGGKPAEDGVFPGRQRRWRLSWLERGPDTLSNPDLFEG